MGPRSLTFSERMGIMPVRESIQIDGMDLRLRVAIFNYVYELFVALWDCENEYGDRVGIGELLARKVWCKLYSNPIDEFPYYSSEFLSFLKREILGGSWASVYDLMECIVQEDIDALSRAANDFNDILEDELSGFRFAGGVLVQISGEEELLSLSELLKVDDKYSGARKHIQAAVELFSDRDNPDYRNVVKEAISAVESAVLALVPNSGKARFGELINRLERQGRVHPALAKAWKEMYGFTSDEDGIRHALSSESSTVDFKMAKYMLVTCSAFVNYLVQFDAETLEG